MKAPSKKQIKELGAEYQRYVEAKHRAWQKRNPPPTPERRNNVVDEMIANGPRNDAYRDRWIAYIDPLSMAWWAERGFELFYESDKCGVRVLEGPAKAA